MEGQYKTWGVQQDDREKHGVLFWIGVVLVLVGFGRIVYDPLKAMYYHEQLPPVVHLPEVPPSLPQGPLPWQP